MQNTNPANIGVHWGSVNLCCSQFGSIPIFNLSILNSYQSSGCCWVALCTLLIVITNLYKYAYTVGDKKSNIATNIFFIKINLPVIEKINKYVHKIIYVG